MYFYLDNFDRPLLEKRTYLIHAKFSLIFFVPAGEEFPDELAFLSGVYMKARCVIVASELARFVPFLPVVSSDSGSVK
jgi:hypothetical protein